MGNLDVPSNDNDSGKKRTMESEAFFLTGIMHDAVNAKDDTDWNTIRGKITAAEQLSLARSWAESILSDDSGSDSPYRKLAKMVKELQQHDE